MSVGIKLARPTKIFRAVHAPQVDDSKHAIKSPLIIPILNPCIYIVTTATGTVSKILSNLIQVAIIKAMAIGIILICFLDRDKIISAIK